MDDREAPNSGYPTPKADEPPLHRAARVGDVALIRRLARDGHEIDAVFNIQLHPDAVETPATPLMVAAGSGDGASVESVELLLELGADAKVVLCGSSAAQFACSGLGLDYKPGGDAERLQVLLSRGSPLPSSPDILNRLICSVAGSGDSERLAVLLDHGLDAKGHWDRDEAEKRSQALMGFFAGQQQLAGTEIKQIEEMFKDSSSAPSSFEIPLFCAAESGNVECVRLLLKAGADPAVRDNSKRSAMYSACSTEVIREFTSLGLAIEDTDEYGWSPLVDALSRGEEGLSIIRALIECGADVNATHDRGYTVFMSAVGSDRCPEVMRELVAAGADPHAVTELGYNAFHAAIDVNFGANHEDSVRDTFSYLNEIGVDIEHRNSTGQTPLATAIDEDGGMVVRVLCELGANPNAVCPMRRCRGGSCSFEKMAILFNATDGSGVHRHVKTKALLEAGADPLVQDDQGYTPLVRTIAALCEDAPDYEQSFDKFYDGLQELHAVAGHWPRTRAEFVAKAMPLLDTYVNEFASKIPVRRFGGYGAEWRVERIACIILLCAHEGGARAEQAQRAVDSDDGSSQG